MRQGRQDARSGRGCLGPRPAQPARARRGYCLVLAPIVRFRRRWRRQRAASRRLRALTGSQASGDAYVAAALEALVICRVSLTASWPLLGRANHARNARAGPRPPEVAQRGAQPPKPVGPDHPSRCSVCLKRRDEVKAMFTNPRPHNQFFVCNECIAEMHQACNEIIARNEIRLADSIDREAP
jgi:ClpX C4-type zinc finger